MSFPVTPHFQVQDFASHDGEAYPPEWIDTRLRPLCEQLEVIRAELGGKPIYIISGYRTPAHNAAVNGKLHSQHLQGRAADIRVLGVEPAVVHDCILMMVGAGKLPLVKGLGRYPTKPDRPGFVHVDIRPAAKLVRWDG